MGDINDLLVLLALGAVIGLWLKLSASRERAIHEARRQCDRYGLQLLDETVSLRRLRLRHINGRRRLERCYGFEVSIDGDDREQGSLWLLDGAMTGLDLPTVTLVPGHTINKGNPHEPDEHGPTDARAGNNVVPLHPRQRSGGRLH